MTYNVFGGTLNPTLLLLLSLAVSYLQVGLSVRIPVADGMRMLQKWISRQRRRT